MSVFVLKLIAIGTMFIDHLTYRVNIILSVTVHRDGDVSMLLCLHKPGDKSILMSPVARQGDCTISLILLAK